MADIPNGVGVYFLRGLFIDADECPDLSRWLGRKLTLADRIDDQPTPEGLLDFMTRLREAAESSSARFRDQSTRNITDEPFLSSSDPETVWLDTKEAASRAGYSCEYMRRCFAQGDPEASRGQRSAWFVDSDSLDAWIISRRRKTPSRRKAA